MKKDKVLVIAMEGYYANFRKDEITLSETLKDVFKDYENKLEIHINIFDSQSLYAVKRAKQFIEFMEYINTFDSIMLIGKSMGGAKIYHFLRKHFQFTKNHVKIGAMMIDAHGTWFHEWNPIPLSTIRKMKMKKEWYVPNMRIYNVYQHNKYPCGASLKDCYKNIKLDKWADHWNVISNVNTFMYLKDCLDWLTE